MIELILTILVDQPTVSIMKIDLTAIKRMMLSPKDIKRTSLNAKTHVVWKRTENLCEYTEYICEYMHMQIYVCMWMDIPKIAKPGKIEGLC